MTACCQLDYSISGFVRKSAFSRLQQIEGIAVSFFVDFGWDWQTLNQKQIQIVIRQAACQQTNLQAALSLRESYMLKAPSAKLSGKDKAAVVAKELGDFLGHYKRETELFTVFREESGMIPRHIFEEFVAFASDSGVTISIL